MRKKKKMKKCWFSNIGDIKLISKKRSEKDDLKEEEKLKKEKKIFNYSS
jgi:hypothetical protein